MASRVLGQLLVCPILVGVCICMCCAGKGVMGTKQDVFTFDDPSGLQVVLRQKAAGLLQGAVTRMVGEARVRLTWQEAIQGLQADAGLPDAGLRGLLSKALKDVPLQAFFWECAPVSHSTAAQRSFEFVVLDAPPLQGIDADLEPFSSHLSAAQGKSVAVSFVNLGGDAMLVAPAEAAHNKQAYAHIANFFRMAPDAQHDALWRELGAALSQRLEAVGPNTTVWVNTEGSGVYWLHIRLDSRPKYYHYGPYRNPDFPPAHEDL